MYLKNSNYYSKGIYFKYLINEIELIYNKYDLINNNDINEINITVNIDKKDIGQKIYFLDNKYVENDFEYLSHDNFKEFNEFNTDLYINKKKETFKKYFVPSNDGILTVFYTFLFFYLFNINIKFNKNLKDCSYMFAGCENIININFISFNTKFVENMKFMFYGCKNIKNINLLS